MSLTEIARRARVIQIYCTPNGVDLRQKLTLSNGTRPATSLFGNGAIYESRARIACEPWNQLTPTDLRLLVTDRPPLDYGKSVLFLRFPPLESRSDREAIWRNDPDVIARRIFGPVLKICKIGDPIECLGALEGPPNASNTTLDPQTGKRIGLHVDSWHAPYESRPDLLPNRISVNVGNESRYFMFMPVSLTDMRNILQEEMGTVPVPWQDRSGLGRLFMERFPLTPVVRCQIEPWEAYVAPTENLVHDGSSSGQSESDRQYVLLGSISLAT